jgi:hypothetical protein
MGKIKNLLKKSTKIGASALLLVSTLLPSLALQGQLIVSATNAPLAGPLIQVITLGA